MSVDAQRWSRSVCDQKPVCWECFVSVCCCCVSLIVTRIGSTDSVLLLPGTGSMGSKWAAKLIKLPSGQRNKRWNVHSEALRSFPFYFFREETAIDDWKKFFIADTCAANAGSFQGQLLNTCVTFILNRENFREFPSIFASNWYHRPLCLFSGFSIIHNTPKQENGNKDIVSERSAKRIYELTSTR